MPNFSEYFKKESLIDLQQIRNAILFSTWLNVNDVLMTADQKLKKILLDYIDELIKGVINDEM